MHRASVPLRCCLLPTRYDEWVHITRVLKRNRESLALQTQLMESLATSTGGSRRDKGGAGGSRRRTAAAAASTGGTPAKRAKEKEGLEDESEFLARADVRLTVPDDLKHRLIDDYEKINKAHKVRKRECRASKKHSCTHL